jgi:hypothetical protein
MKADERFFGIPWKRAALATCLTSLLMGAALLPLRAEYLRNTDFKEGSQLWRGDGQAAFIKPDGTECGEGDPDAIPVLRVVLAKGHPCAIRQDYLTPDNPRIQHLQVEVYASIDFKRSRFASDYDSEDSIPNADFCIRARPGDADSNADLKPGQWVTVKGSVDSAPPSNERTIVFMIPPGEGIIYIRNPSATP